MSKKNPKSQSASDDIESFMFLLIHLPADIPKSWLRKHFLT